MSVGIIKGQFAIITLKYYYICRGGECYFETDVSSVSDTGDLEKEIKPMTFLWQVQMLCHCVNSWQLTCKALCTHRLSRRFWSVYFVYAGLSLTAGARGFSLATKRVAPGYFIGKQKKNRTKRNPQALDSPPSCCIYPAT